MNEDITRIEYEPGIPLELYIPIIKIAIILFFLWVLYQLLKFIFNKIYNGDPGNKINKLLYRFIKPAFPFCKKCNQRFDCKMGHISHCDIYSDNKGEYL